MGLKAILDTVDDLPEPAREFYKEDNGKFVLDIDDVDNHPKVRGVVTANKENVKKRDAYKAKLDELAGKYANVPEDFDAEEWARLRAAGDNKPDAAIQAVKEQHARFIENLNKKHADELTKREKELLERDAYIESVVRDGGLKDALLGVGVEPDLLDGALASLRPAVKVHRTDDGKRMAVVETDMGQLDLSVYVKDWAGSKGKAYLRKPTGPNPGGSNRPGTNGPKVMTRSEFEAMSQPERMAKFKEGYRVSDAA